MANKKKLYGRRDTIGQGVHYINHLSTMNSEGLHSKADIAKELAHRDIKIKQLQKIAGTLVLTIQDGEEVIRIKREVMNIINE